MKFRVLGPLESEDAGRVVPLGGGKPRALLGMLLLRANEPVSVDRLIDGLWGERPPARAAKLVQGYVSALRKVLGPDRLVTQRPGYAVRVGPSELDSLEFERLVALAHTMPTEPRARCLRRALALWRGSALADVRLEGIAAGEAARLNQLQLTALLDRIDADLARGRHEELIGELETVVAAHPLVERPRGQLMLALYRARRRAEALEAYRLTRLVFTEELGIDPDSDLQSLHDAILRQDPVLMGEQDGAGRRPDDLQLPDPMRLASPYPFVGRSSELDALRSLLSSAVGDRRRIALLGGPAGSGKTRLVRELGRDVVEEGVLVLYGSCDPVVRAPHGPLVEALDHLVQVAQPDALRADLGPAGGELSRILPHLTVHVGELPGPVGADPDTERHRLHTAVSDLLANTSRRHLLLLVLEDVHWADTSTLLLLRHLARSAATARLVVLATFRDTEADVPTALADALAELRRSEDVVRLDLRGLTEVDIGQFVRDAARGEPDTALARAMHRLTAGNPFLLCELWRSLLETESVNVVGGIVVGTRPFEEIAAPEGVREVTGQRLSRLPAETRDLLELAAVAGPEFDLVTLQRAAPSWLERLDALEPAERSGMIEELQQPSLAYRFTHELVRRALYDGVRGVRRVELHLRIAEALEAGPRSRSARELSDLAHHFTVAAPLAGTERAVTYNLLAAEAAGGTLAFDEEAALLRTALNLGIDDERLQAETWLRLGEACLRGGQSLSSIQAYGEAADVARRTGDGMMLGRAAVGLGEACWRGSVVSPHAIGLLEEASAALRRRDSALRVRVLGGLADALAARGDHARSVVVRTRAATIARRINDQPGLAAVLAHAYWARGGMALADVVGLLTESQGVAARIGDGDLHAEVTAWKAIALMSLANVDAARVEITTVAGLGHRVRQPFILYIAEQLSAALALLEGRLQDAEEAAERSREWGRLLRGRSASATYGIQMFAIRREQGRLDELAPLARSLVSRGAGGFWRPALAVLLAELGMEADVERELAQIRRAGLDSLRQSLWVGSLVYLTDACTAVGDEQLAALLYPELAPLAGTNLMIGSGVVVCGAADRYLGRLAATLGDLQRADKHLAAALALDRRMGATTWVAHTCYEYGRILRATGDVERSDLLLAEADTIAEQVVMPTLRARIRDLRGRPGSRRVPDGLSKRETDVVHLIARGLSNREIGAALSISEHTAANHVRNILRKTGCTNRTEVASWAHRYGLVGSPPRA